MGRKQKKNTKVNASQASGQSKSPTAKEDEPANAPASAPVELSKSAKKDVAELNSQLLQLCSKPPESGAKEWDDYPEIHGMIEKIRAIQSGLAAAQSNRVDAFPAFITWLSNNEVDTSAVEITEFPGCGFGLKATRDLKEAEKVLQIPRKLMLTVDSAKQSSLEALINEDKILQVMPNVTLALHLLNEKLSEQSFWKPYIDILPTEYGTPLYWSSSDLQLLKGSPVQGDAINQYRNIARQYAYFYRLLQKNEAASKLPLKDGFTFDNYRWAVSSVMTRQNQIPASDGSRATLGLIPLWDMCNHTNGFHTSDYNSEVDACECFCLRNFSCGDQILIFYGPRSNGEFLVHNGFVYPENDHDRICVKLGISKGDSLFSLKSNLLSKINLLPSRSFYLHKGKFPVDNDLLAFLRVFSMDEETLNSRYQNEDEMPKELEKLKDELEIVSATNEEKVWSFLITRINILLKAYPSTVEEDRTSLENDMSTSARMAVQLKICEREILENTLKYAENKKSGLEQEQRS